MATILKPHHLDSVETQVATALKALFSMRLTDDVQQHASMEIIQGKPLDQAVRAARMQIKRDTRRTAWLSLDEDREDSYSLAEIIAASDPAEIMDAIISQRSRSAEFGTFDEKVISNFSLPTRVKADASGLTQRRHQQINKQQVARTRQESDFAAGRAGQGALFGWEVQP